MRAVVEATEAVAAADTVEVAAATVEEVAATVNIAPFLFLKYFNISVF